MLNIDFMPFDETIIKQAVERYKRESDRYSKLAQHVADECRSLIQDKVIRGTVQWRVKDPDRFASKLRLKYMNDGAINTVEDIFARIDDLAGVRVTTYIETERQKVVHAIVENFGGRSPNTPVIPDVKDGKTKSRFYRATHCQVTVLPENCSGSLANVSGDSCEIQICSLLAHVYNEIEHDFTYKTLSGDVSKDEIELSEALGHMTASGDTIIKQLIFAVDSRQKQMTGPFVDVHDFVSRMRDLFPKAERFPDNAYQLFAELMDLSLHTPQLVHDYLLKDDYENRTKRMFESFFRFLNETESGLRIDYSTSDQLLLLLLDDFADQVVQNHPGGRGAGRIPRIAQIARKFVDWKAREQQVIAEEMHDLQPPTVSTNPP